MLVYNNKLLMVGGKAIKYVVARTLSITLSWVQQTSVTTRYSWSRYNTSQDDWPSNFGDSNWKCSTDSTLWGSGASTDYIIRGGMIANGSFNRTLKSYIFPAIFQLDSSTGLLSWVVTPENYSATIVAGSTTTTKSSTLGSQLSNKIFNSKLGTFHSDRTIYFGFLAWTSSTPNSLESFAFCCASNSPTNRPVMTLVEQI